MREQWLQGKEQEQLLALVRRILRWLPEERPSAEDLFEDAFFQSVYLSLRSRNS